MRSTWTFSAKLQLALQDKQQKKQIHAKNTPLAILLLLSFAMLEIF